MTVIQWEVLQVGVQYVDWVSACSYVLGVLGDVSGVAQVGVS